MQKGCHNFRYVSLEGKGGGGQVTLGGGEGGFELDVESMTWFKGTEHYW